MSSTPMEVVAAVYQAFAVGDTARLGELLAEVDWEEAAGMPYGGRYKGAQAVFENVFGPIAADVQDFSAKPDELMAVGTDRVLSRGVYRGAGKAGALEAHFAHLWTVGGSHIRGFVQYADTAKFREAVGR